MPDTIQTELGEAFIVRNINCIYTVPKGKEPREKEDFYQFGTSYTFFMRKGVG